MKIGLTCSESRNQKYIDWLEYFKVDFNILDYKHPEEGFEEFKKCSGLILSGGVDIYPELYCDWDTKETKGTYKPDRDGFELKLLESAIERKLPVLAICRGLQLVNVFFRGSLIFDLWDIRKVDHSKISDSEYKIHKINIFKDTLLYEITNETEADVTSSHHQAIDRLGEGLMINAKSEDGIIEGIEYLQKDGKSFLLGIQWHPERYKDYNEATSKNIILKFLSEAEKINL